VKTTFLSHSISDTLYIGKKVASRVYPGNVITLHGHVGSGKTILVKGFCLGLGVQDDITSPSYTIMNCYSGQVPIYHFDFYRLDHGSNWSELGLDEYLFDDGISFIEWPDRYEKFLPKDHVEVFIRRVRPYSTDNENYRQISIHNLELDDINLQHDQNPVNIEE
jgi:tRNA threonylcarbamoyladenosine biosynthesis protein TsaE